MQIPMVRTRDDGLIEACGKAVVPDRGRLARSPERAKCVENAGGTPAVRKPHEFRERRQCRNSPARTRPQARPRAPKGDGT